MNISRKWLREFVDITATDKEYDSVMTLAGQKVETTERMDAEIKNVVVGKVLSMKKHENSDHMWVCMVDCGAGEPVQIVTGAQNVHEGDLVPVAQHNSYLPGGIHITKGKLRGVESCGMLCSYKELGLTEHDCPEAYADGIWILNDEGCTVGEDMNIVIGNDDSIVEFEITNNRPDCYSLIGLARETAAAFNVPMKHHEPVVKGGAEGDLGELLDVDVQADDLCPRYTARMVRNVKIAPSPKWMRQRLRSAGIRPINNIVDITNYVMVEYGQPMHAFDYRYVKGGKIVVRRAGEVMDGMIDVLNYVPQPVTVKLEPERINALLGTDIPEADMIEYLRRVEVPVVDGMIQVPSWRPDLRVMADIAEEVARYYGYNNIETTLMRGATTMGGYSDAQKLENAAGAAARAMGYSEIITYSFVSPASFDAIRIPADSPLRRTVKLVNPLGEDTSIMRTVILPSMLDILSRNFAFKNKGVKLYEIGKIYLPKDGEKLPDEPKRMIFGTYGEHENFFTLKGEIDAILDQLNVHPATYIADTKNPSYHPGRCADIVIDGKKMGVIGQIHPLVAETYGIGGEVYVAELDFTGLQAVLAPERVFHSLPKFPTVSRDLALVCEESMTVGMLEACIKKAGGKLLRSVQLFDIYRGPGIAPGKKSIAFSLELRADDRTLTDEDTTGVMNAVLEKLKNDLGVSLR